MNFAYHKRDLPNGIRLRAVKIPQSPTVTFAVLVGAGSRNETPEQSGLAHFIEHNILKGTPSLPSPQAVSIALESVGAVNNAFTSYEFTGYWAKATPKRLPEIARITSDIFLNPLFPEKDLNIERGNVIEELNMYEDNPKVKVEEEFFCTVFKGHPLGQKIIGTKENLLRFNQQDLSNFKDCYYAPGKIVVIAVGDVDPNSFFQMVDPIFRNYSKGQDFANIPYLQNQTSIDVNVINRKLDQTHIMLGVRGLTTNDPRDSILDVANEILGGPAGMGSRLFNKIRNELGLAYYVSSSNDEFTDTGLWSAQAGLQTAGYLEGVKAIWQEFGRMAAEKITDEELSRAKEHLKGIIAITLESTSQVMQYFGIDELTKLQPESPEEKIAKIEAVTADDVQALAQELVRSDKLTVAVLGPFEEKAEKEKILELVGS